MRKRSERQSDIWNQCHETDVLISTGVIVSMDIKHNPGHRGLDAIHIRKDAGQEVAGSIGWLPDPAQVFNYS